MGIELFLLQVFRLFILCLLSWPAEDEVRDLVGGFLVQTHSDLLVDSFRRAFNKMELTDVVDENGEKGKAVDGDEDNIIIVKRYPSLHHFLAL